MKIEKIRPVPQYIVERIRKLDNKTNIEPAGATRYYSYLTKNDGELVKVTVAVRYYRKKWLYKQVAVHGIHSKDCFVKDMVLYYIGGYHTGWSDEGIGKYEKWYEGGWGTNEDKYFNPFAPLVNKEFIDKLPEYKYSEYKNCNMDVLQYLRIYEKYPQTEYLIKAGLAKLVTSKQILERVGKDKSFRKYLYKNRDIIMNNYLYTHSILKAYKTGKSLLAIQNLEVAKKSLNVGNYKDIRELFKGKTDAFLEYIAKNETSISSYNDYLRACRYLGLDMSLEKNLLPHDFKRWHDIRIDEYRTKRALEEAEKRKELYDKFSIVADKYTPLQKMSKGVFVCIIAKSPEDLIREGEHLHHCVGRMNYDQKFIREETLIFFIRNANEPEKPLVTIEYSLSKKKILQCYGDHDSKPNADIEEFVYKKWLPYANRKLKKIAA